jgi:hypothetical protein
MHRYDNTRANLEEGKEKGKKEAPPYQESPTTILQSRRVFTVFVSQMQTTRTLQT